MVLTATELAQKLLAHAPHKPVLRVDESIRKFLMIAQTAKLEVSEERDRFKVTLPDGQIRWFWIKVVSDEVTLFWQWGGIIDCRPYRPTTVDIRKIEETPEERRRRTHAVRRYVWRHPRKPGNSEGIPPEGPSDR